MARPAHAHCDTQPVQLPAAAVLCLGTVLEGIQESVLGALLRRHFLSSLAEGLFSWSQSNLGSMQPRSLHPAAGAALHLQESHLWKGNCTFPATSWITHPGLSASLAWWFSQLNKLPLAICSQTVNKKERNFWKSLALWIACRLGFPNSVKNGVIASGKWLRLALVNSPSHKLWNCWPFHAHALDWKRQQVLWKTASRGQRLWEEKANASPLLPPFSLWGRDPGIMGIYWVSTQFRAQCLIVFFHLQLMRYVPLRLSSQGEIPLPLGQFQRVILK